MLSGVVAAMLPARKDRQELLWRQRSPAAICCHEQGQPKVLSDLSRSDVRVFDTLRRVSTTGAEAGCIYRTIMINAPQMYLHYGQLRGGGSEPAWALSASGFEGQRGAHAVPLLVWQCLTFES